MSGRVTDVANDKVISTQALIDKFKQALSEHWGYIWGTRGETWTAAKQAKLEKTTDADRTNSRKYGSKWIGRKVADCSGLFSWAFAQLGGYMYHGSDTMWRKYCQSKGELRNGKRTDGEPLLPGTAVFTYNKKTGKRGHVGLYIGGGKVIEARGAYYGVVETKLTSRPWVEWGELKGVNYSGTNTEPETPKEDGNTMATLPTIRKGNKNVYVTQLQTMLDKLGYNLGICGIDGDYGTATEKAVKEFQRDHGLTQDGVTGPQTWTAIQEAVNKLTAKPAEEHYTVTITGLTKKEADELCAKWKTATLKKE